jgi:hypothetical protein
MKSKLLDLMFEGFLQSDEDWMQSSMVLNLTRSSSDKMCGKFVLL